MTILCGSVFGVLNRGMFTNLYESVVRPGISSAKKCKNSNNGTRTPRHRIMVELHKTKLSYFRAFLTRLHVHPAKTQISYASAKADQSSPDVLEPLLSEQCPAKTLIRFANAQADSVFAGRTCNRVSSRKHACIILIPLNSTFIQ